MIRQRVFRDMMDRTVEIKHPLQKILSLVPSQTELLYELGLREEIKGVTKFCVHPENLRKEKTVIGGTKKLRLDAIKELQPDLIIANKEENLKEEIERLAADFPVWVSDVKNLSQATDMILRLAEITGKEEEANALVNTIKVGFASIPSPEHRPKAVYLIWKNPYMAAGGDTFIHEMLKRAGFENLTGDRARYPVLPPEAIEKLNPEVILLSSEPYPFQEKHIEEIRQIVPRAEICLVDGELFSWYGSRLKFATSYFQKLQKVIKAFSPT